MNKLSSFSALVAAVLIAIAAESAWSGEAMPSGAAAAPEQAPVPDTVDVPGGYAQRWQQPQYWPAPPHGYGQMPPYYPPQGQYRAGPATHPSPEHPLSAMLRQTQEQLTAKSIELDMADATLEQLRTRLQQSLESELALYEKMVNITNDQEQTRTLITERDRLRDDIASRDEQLTALQAELQTATQALQQARSETTTLTRQLSEARAQAEISSNTLTELKAQLESRKTALLDTEQTLANVIAERDKLQADMAAHKGELARAQDALTTAQSEVDALHQANSEAAVVIVAPAVSKGLDADAAVEIAALQTAAADADEDSVPDSIDLCRETPQGISVEPTGCAAGVAIKLEGVNFRYDSHELTDKAKHILDRVADILSQRHDMRLEVAGHTDAQGDTAYNQWLSLERAKAVRDYMVTQGVNPDHIGASGYGGTRPLADNTTKQGLRMNRRVELHRLQ